MCLVFFVPLMFRKLTPTKNIEQDDKFSYFHERIENCVTNFVTFSKKTKISKVLSYKGLPIQYLLNCYLQLEIG